MSLATSQVSVLLGITVTARVHYNVLRLERCTCFQHGTARLHLSFCRAGLKIGTELSTGGTGLSTDFFPRHGTAECLHLRKSCARHDTS